MKKLTHTTGKGKASMVDVSNKKETMRTAKAYAEVLLGKKAFTAVFHVPLGHLNHEKNVGTNRQEWSLHILRHPGRAFEPGSSVLRTGQD